MKKLVIQTGLVLSGVFLLQGCSKTEQESMPAAATAPAPMVAAAMPETASAPSWPYTSILDVMQQVVTPATDTLWGVGDPATDEEWKVLEDASQTVIDAANQVAKGGSGPNDNQWASDPAFQAMNQLMLNAGKASLAAAQAHDLDQLVAVGGDDLYPPCEACHLQFNPGVVGEQ